MFAYYNSSAYCGLREAGFCLLLKRTRYRRRILVSGFLIPLIMPPATPLWIVALATTFALVIAKILAVRNECF
ncbi:MAG: RnfABCDGE type electron transport complex subunit D [Chitinophagales bacterium]